MTDSTIASPDLPDNISAEQEVPNSTIQTLLERRTIRAFDSTPIPPKTVELLELTAQHAATSRYFNEWSAIRVSDPELLATIAKESHQPYIAQAPLLYIFLADQRRNADLIAAEAPEVSTEDEGFILNTSYAFLQAQNDAVLALHAMETAANSLGLGCVILGSVINDPDTLIDLLQLPKLVYPVLGLAIGKPAQAPDPKPRMPQRAQIFTNSYQRASQDEIRQALDEFDQRVLKYYHDIRHVDAPRKTFSQIMADKALSIKDNHSPMAPSIERQGFDLSK
ncbi:NADPH-dependent oxidoreductase [Bombiscardovia apis]|uniref:NADPH-dependent oxidoreductase n=1 Tax=Bombiscardovia apis TaxID=2932182 RepID=A0ABM8BAX2_9BIFI|nr:nitroreductase family protein [Bombiscardovia apis]BDR53986.1 NADPH-dependent oxidoreductase [Bombiscardovia apis]